MNEYNYEDELYNNNNLMNNEKNKTNKYNEDEIIMDENLNNTEEDNNINYGNEDNEEYDINNDLNNNEQFDNQIEENDDNNNYDYNNNYENFDNNEENVDNPEEEQNLIYEKENDEELNNNNINTFDNMNEFSEGNINYNDNNNINQYTENNFGDVNDIESMKLYIINLENKCSALEKENKMMKSKNNPNYGIIENSIKQGTILLDDVKRKNFNLNKKIKILEKQNQELNYKLIEANQKLKKFQKNKIENFSNNQNTNSIILNLNNKIDENEIIISKLKLDKKILENKLSEEKKNHENELNLMLNYKNSELSVYQKAIDDFKSQKNNSIYLNNENLINDNNQMNSLKNKLKSTTTKNKNLEEKIKELKQNLSEKDDIIDDLNKRVIELEGNLNLKCIEIQQLSAENETRLSQLINEKNELIKNNEKLSNGLLQFDNKVKEANMIFINKTEFYNKSINIFKNKINEYKNKIALLKNKINELNSIIEKNKNKVINNQHKLNRPNIYQKDIISTPGSFLIPRRKMTPFTQKFFDEKSEYFEIRNNNMNKTNLDILESNSMNYFNKNNLNKKNESEYEEENNPKRYLEHYKSFLSGLDTKLKI